MPTDIPFLIEQVSKCLRLSELCGDAEIAAKLIELSRLFAQRAIELGAAPGLIPEIPQIVPPPGAKPKSRKRPVA